MNEPVQWALVRTDLLQDLLAETEGATAAYHLAMKGHRQDEHDRLDALVERARLALALPDVPWANEIQVLQDQIQQLELDLECARRNEASVTYWTGQDDGVRGACLRWQEALTEVIPKAGTMQEPLESLYRQTEGLRLELLQAESDSHLVRGQRDGYAYLLSGVLDVIEKHWQPHNEASRSACEGILNSLGGMHDAAWAAIKANATQPMTYAIEQRLRLIDFLLEHYGHVGRPELVSFFGISIPCASADIQRYNADNPGNAVYDFKSKRWTRTEAFVPRFS